MKQRYVTGFTLVEMMVVTSIIALLGSTVLVSVNAQRLKAVDTQRIAGVHAIQTALESYYDDHHSFPYITTPSSAPMSIISSADPEWNTLASYLVPQYLSAMPTLPITWTSDNYYQEGYVVSFSLPEAKSLQNGSNIMQWTSNINQPYQYTCLSPYGYQVGVSFAYPSDPNATT